MPEAELAAKMGDIYWVQGVNIVVTLGTAISVVVIGGKIIWFLSKLDSKADKAINMAARAHKRIDKWEHD